MGNSESKSESSKDPKSPHARGQHKEKERHTHDGNNPNARRQLPPSHSNSATLAHLTPTSTLTSTHGTLAASPSISTSEIHGHGATVSGSSHSRQRSVTAGNRSKPDDISSSHKSDSSAMGNEQSKAKAPVRSSTHPSATPSEKEQPTPLPEPVAVPQSSHEDFAHRDDLTPPGAASPYGLPPSNFDRPPRLPLPIERDPEPASPLLSPTDMTSPAEANDGEGLRRRHSMLSSTTLDDDEEIDAATFNMDNDSSQPKQPTTIYWRYPADQVYITGSFVDWQRKLKMQKDAQTGQHSILLQLSPGTHHMKFLVDGEMRPSDEYPTTVDFTNALMNYLEIMPQPPAPAVPMPIPGAAANQTPGQTGGSADTPQATRASETEDGLSSTLHETVVPAPGTATAGQSVTGSDTRPQEQQPPKPPKKQIPRPKYTRDIPELLLHLDLYANPNDERYQRASKAMQNLPHPPTLPMFMQRSILNANTPHKDDASVLTMPNHTVLNHLATSSIRSGVLATSGTTRYKRKFLTTIMYKPTTDSG